jgi:hypothetical protein
MWEKCGTKILNEINKVKKSAIFFGSGIYSKKSVFVSFPHEMSGFVRFGAKGTGAVSFRQFCAATRVPAPKPCVLSNKALQRRF